MKKHTAIVGPLIGFLLGVLFGFLLSPAKQGFGNSAGNTYTIYNRDKD